ncbi:hypothetical protein TSTA_016090 [Talaromyces stipitatus ATCC 10500]|uniref:GPI anchored protein n=1 Tax=Talaromyces stipitatus (strain ATCC 10500 / CBS 375.48 / QM 6759 / NRRL 1006) TaxID=441959 RepID=B8MEA2_TALSN|nr:uncharacterized protein TSTA_016090 [Talaromyces stipitatus ATCC 10500]EED16529.1 hypothetical protein TSTA_016090 [Talaromyces stipitatus ATCC 10500]
MKTVYTAIPLALLAAVAQADSQAAGAKQSRDLASDDSEKGDFLGDAPDHNFLGSGWNDPHKHSHGGHDVPSAGGEDDGDLAPGFVSSPKDSPFGGPHNFNEQAGPDTFSGFNDNKDGVNNDNIVITPINSYQAAQAQEQDDYILPPGHPGPPDPLGPSYGGPGHVEHQPEQLPPQQHSEPKQAPPEEHHEGPSPPAYKPEPKEVVPQPTPAPYTPAPVLVPAPVPSAHELLPERHELDPPCPEGEDGSHPGPEPQGADSYASPVAPKEVSKPYPGGNHPEGNLEGHPEGHPDGYHSVPAGNPFQPPQPPQPPIVQPPYPFPHATPSHDDDDDDIYVPHPGPHPGPSGPEDHGSYPASAGHPTPSDSQEHGSYPDHPHPDSYPAPAPAPTPYQAPGAGDHSGYPAPVAYPSPSALEGHGAYPDPAPSHEDHPHGSYPLPDHHDDSGSDTPYPAPGGYQPPQAYREPTPDQPKTPVHPDPETKPEPAYTPGHEYSKPPSQPFVPHPQVTASKYPSSISIQASPTPSSARHASYALSSHHTAAHSTTSCTFTSTASKTGGPSTTAPNSVSPSAFTGGAGSVAAPGGFGVAVVGALALLL